MNYQDIGRRLEELLGLDAKPVSVTFLAEAPEGLSRVTSPAPAGCAYWKLAAEGKIFYTTGVDHLGCPIGAYTHGVALPADNAAELQSTLNLMTGLKYLRSDEVEKIPHRTHPFQALVYAPLSKAPLEPDVVLVRGKAKQIMLISEAAQVAEIGAEGAIMGRPACSVIASTMQTGRVTTSLGCIGNRVYTGLPDDEFYIALPGSQLSEILTSIENIVSANKKLEELHLAKRAQG